MSSVFEFYYIHQVKVRYFAANVICQDQFQLELTFNHNLLK